MDIEHFKLNSSEEVRLFSDRLDAFQKSKLGHSLSYIDLNIAFEKLQGNKNGGRLFTALLDLKLNFIMLYIDIHSAGVTWNQYFYNKEQDLNGGSVLDNQMKFNGKAEIQYYYGNFIPRYRAIWDKIMGIFILFFKPDKYKKYRKAKSRKKAFEDMCNDIPQISNELVKEIISLTLNFDQNFRTPEVHGTGTIRKWSFSMISFHKTPLLEFNNYWNSLLRLLAQLDSLLLTIQ